MSPVGSTTGGGAHPADEGRRGASTTILAPCRLLLRVDDPESRAYEAAVRYALPEGDQQIFASRYKLHLPTEEELAAELQRERRQIEPIEGSGGQVEEGRE